MNSATTTTYPYSRPVDGRSFRWEEHRAQRRLELIASARKAVHRIGPSASMEDIAAASHTSKSVFYRYFGDKDGLRHSMGEVVINQLREAVIEAGESKDRPDEALFSMVHAYLAQAERSPNTYEFVTANLETGASGALAHFFNELTVMMRERMADYLRVNRTQNASMESLKYWPDGALGMIRSVGESWLRASPHDPARPNATELARQVTDWLVYGISSVDRTARQP
ncbi:TetR/AcrR family transcriptional regulator [Neomicrococcus lactis]|uniref:TetR/AcrR family transcriptional regulator n=1 Tax=Neomicrococcus lactis TaxID=732241 RepID=UPI002301C875|nr:TetR/AcrR family transcriptional regulator [Neomicrococcus lactis]